MQQINLYTDELKPKKVILPLSQMIAGLSVLLIALVAIQLIYRAEVVKLEGLLVPRQQSLDLAQQQVLEREAQLKRLQKDESLVTLNHKLNQQVAARKQLLTMLDSVVTANRYPFSNLLTGLARQRVDRLWLTQIKFANGGETVGLKGQALKAEAVPHYLQMLRGEALLLGRSFNLFQLSTDEEKGEILHFTLSSSLLSDGVNNE